MVFGSWNVFVTSLTHLALNIYQIWIVRRRNRIARMRIQHTTQIQSFEIGLICVQMHLNQVYGVCHNVRNCACSFLMASKLHIVSTRAEC